MAGRGRGRGGGGMGGRPAREPPKVFGNGRFPQPSSQVTKLENEMVKSSLSSAMAASSLDFALPSRPAYGSAGRAVVLYTNFFELKGAKADTQLYRYSLSFLDEEISNPRKKRLIELLLSMPPFSETKVASDWSQKLVSTEKIPLDEMGQVYMVTFFPKGGCPYAPPTADEDSRLTKARKNNTYQINVQQLGTVSLAELVRDISQPTFNYPLKLEAIDALNTVMTYGPSCQASVTTASGSTFYPFGSHPQSESTELGGGLQAQRGYFTSVRTSVSRLLVNVNVTTGAFYKPGPLLDLITQVNGRMPANQSELGRAASFVNKVRIETNYLKESKERNKENKGTKRKVLGITGLSPYGKNRVITNVTFSKQDAAGKDIKITVQQYFLQQHNIRLVAPSAPLVNYGDPEDPKWLPSELCKVVSGQLVRRLLSPEQTSAMITFAARRPYANAESITSNGLEVTKIRNNSNLTAFGIKVDPSMITVPGRILFTPSLQYRGLKTITPNNGAWNLDPRKLGEAPFRVARKLGEWNTLVINSGRYDTIPGGTSGMKSDLEQFRKALFDHRLGPGPVTQPCVVNIPEALLDVKQMGSVATIQATIKAALVKSFPVKPAFLLVLLPLHSVVLYDSIKSLFDCVLGIPSVCCIGSKFTKKSEQYFANVAMKFNQKLGGVNHTVDIKNMAPLDAQTIVFGIDVTHPSPGSDESAPSIAGVVASIDAMFSQYPASMRCQKGRVEMVVELEEMIIERLQLWQKRNQKNLPKKVIVYRDGVGESQYRTVVEVECAAFKQAFDRLYGVESKHPKISIIMVGKRHHTRFYPTALADTDESTGNPKPGTVVDRGVTGEKLFDFFLLAHQGLQGTSRPAHYVVLKDENKLGADQLQKLTHNFCYTFARATRSVSICPPAYYADILCERGRSYLHSVLKSINAAEHTAQSWHRDVNPALMETMYYL